MDLEFMVLDCFEQFQFSGIESEEASSQVCRNIEKAEYLDETYRFVLSHMDDSRGESFL